MVPLPVTSIGPESADGPAPHRRGSVAAIVEHPDRPFIVYGTVIAYHGEQHFENDERGGGKAKAWDVHVHGISRQGNEWVWLRNHYPDHPLVVAGDFNQTPVAPDRYRYGNDRTQAALDAQLSETGLTCVNDGYDVMADHGYDKHGVDHICISQGFDTVDRWMISSVVNVKGKNRNLSDHHIAVADLQFA